MYVIFQLYCTYNISKTLCYSGTLCSWPPKKLNHERKFNEQKFSRKNFENLLSKNEVFVGGVLNFKITL